MRVEGFYKDALRGRFGAAKVNSGNLYQLFAYLENHSAADPTKTHDGRQHMLPTTRADAINAALGHADRRKWASERKHLSIVDVAAAGGWRATSTLPECYMQPDSATLRAVMSEPQRLREAAH